jgi:hypothetical protein
MRLFSSVACRFLVCGPALIYLRSSLSGCRYLDSLLGADHEIGDCTAAVARQRPANNRGMVFSVRSAEQQLNSSKGALSSVRSVPKCFKQDSYSNELVQWQGVWKALTVVIQ